MTPRAGTAAADGAGVSPPKGWFFASGRKPPQGIYFSAYSICFGFVLLT